MSQRFIPSPPQPQPAGRAHRRPSAALENRVEAKQASFGRAGYQVRIGPLGFYCLIGALLSMALWTLLTVGYFVFYDDMLHDCASRQNAVQHDYEDRIAELRMEIDQLTSRQLLDQEHELRKLEALGRRQKVLESRAETLAWLVERASTTAAAGSEPTATPEHPSPIGDTVIEPLPLERDAQLESLPQSARPGKSAGLKAALMRLETALNRLESRQLSTLTGLRLAYDAEAERMRQVLSDLGLDPTKAPAKGPAVGGPFVPAKPPAAANLFEHQLVGLSRAREDLAVLNQTLSAVPIRKPVPGDIDMTSGFGVRLDPFLRTPAMHTGVDFRGEEGEPIHATAAGVVTHAGWNGGYGRMVEIDHGNGLATRYGHLSAIAVDLGAFVTVGEVVGRLGSSGRSTAPHLHYETRRVGDAVDPQKFLRAGARLAGAF